MSNRPRQGRARQFSGDQANSPPGATVGTLDYMTLERFLAGPFDARVDVCISLVVAVVVGIGVLLTVTRDAIQVGDDPWGVVVSPLVWVARAR